MRALISELRVAFLATAVLLFLCCAAYPAAVWVTGGLAFPDQAGGSLVQRGDRVVGSVLLAERFEAPRYFHPRPSCAGGGYDASASGGSNLGPLSKALCDSVGERVRRYREENGLPGSTPVPADAVTASGSGLDPHISPENAALQVSRVASARGMEETTVRALVLACTQGRTFGFLGEPRVNVLELNLALDEGR